MHIQQWSPEMVFTKSPSQYKYDSRSICPGDVFIVLPGGERYIESAIAAGASDLLAVSHANSFLSCLTVCMKILLGSWSLSESRVLMERQRSVTWWRSA